MVPIVRLVAVTAAAARPEASSQRLSTLGTVSICGPKEIIRFTWKPCVTELPLGGSWL
jgi:hypothetical protein